MSSIVSGFLLEIKDHLTLLFERIGKAFNRSRTTHSVALDVSKTFDRVWYAVILHKPKSYIISGQVLTLYIHFLVSL